MRRSPLLACEILILGLTVACSGNPEPEPAPPPPPPPPPAQTDTGDEARREAEASRLCERAIAAIEAGNYDTARDLLRQVLRDYPGTECARRAPGEIERADVLDAITARVHFEFNLARITDEAATILQRKADVLRDRPNVQITIEGHCDERGSIEYNQALGLRRAESAKRYLVSLGLDAARFQTVSFGEERPMVSASGESAWAQNRRDEFRITSGDM